MTKQLRQFLSEHSPFNFLPEAVLDALVDELRMVEYPANTVVCLQGNTHIDSLYIIYRGSLELYYQENGKKTLNGFLEEGDTLGGIAMLLNDGVAIRTARTQEPAVFYLLGKKRFLQLCDQHPEFAEFFTTVFGKRLLDKSYMAIIAKLASQRSESAPPLYNQPVENVCRKDFIACDGKDTIQEAARLMTREKRSSIMIRGKDGRCVGIVTDKDFREKVAAEGLDVSQAVETIMSAPLITIPAQAPIFEAILLMIRKNIKHLAVTDAAGQVFGIISNRRLLVAQGQSPVSMIRDIREAQEPEPVFRKKSQIPNLLRDLIQSGARADHLNRMVTAIADAVLTRLIEIALDELGPPPARFAFVIMGSEGRKEQTLKTDQDNAIIYEDVPPESAPAVNEYFLTFAKKVCGWLDQAGYQYCNGEVMAQNPKWCQPLSVWKNYFRTWIRTPEPMAVMHSTIFFDFVGAYGDLSLTQELRHYLNNLLKDRAGIFFYHLTLNSLKIKPPIGFFRNFVVESKGEHRNTFDIKKAMTPIVDFARCYALEQRLEATNTLERLQQLHLKGVLNEEEYHELTQSYRYLMQIRFMRQVTAVMDEQRKPDNYIDPSKLSNIEQKMLKEIFTLVGKYQQKLSVHFTGSA